MNGVVVLVFLFAEITSALYCNGVADVVVAAPVSLEAISNSEFKSLDFIVADTFNPKREKLEKHIDLVFYGKEAEVINHENLSKTTLAHQRELLHPSIGGGRNVPKAISKVHDHLTTAGRPGVTKIGIIFTYGSQDLSSSVPSEVSQQVSEASKRARDDGINIIVVSANGTTPGIPNTDICNFFAVPSYGEDASLVGAHLNFYVCYIINDFVNPTPGTCLITSQERCEPNTEAPEEEFQCNPGDSFVADPTDCSYYYWCPMGTRMKCAPGTLFDPIIKRCNHSYLVTCNSGLQCPFPYGLFAHPSDCNQFLSCSENVLSVEQCLVGLVFNPRDLRCDFVENVPECGQP